MKHQNEFSKFTIFRLFQSVRAYDNETAAKLVCRGQIGWRKDLSVNAVNFEAIFGPSGGRMLPFHLCPKFICFANLPLQPSICMHILPRWYLHIKHHLGLPLTIHMLYFMLSKLCKLQNTIFKSSNFTFVLLVSKVQISMHVFVLGLVFV